MSTVCCMCADTATIGCISCSAWAVAISVVAVVQLETWLCHCALGRRNGSRWLPTLNNMNLIIATGGERLPSAAVVGTEEPAVAIPVGLRLRKACEVKLAERGAHMRPATARLAQVIKERPHCVQISQATQCPTPISPDTNCIMHGQ